MRVIHYPLYHPIYSYVTGNNLPSVIKTSYNVRSIGHGIEKIIQEGDSLYFVSSNLVT